MIIGVGEGWVYKEINVWQIDSKLTGSDVQNVYLSGIFPPGKSNHCYHPLKTEMFVFWVGLEPSQDSVQIPGISTLLLVYWTEWADLQVNLICLPKVIQSLIHPSKALPQSPEYLGTHRACSFFLVVDWNRGEGTFICCFIYFCIHWLVPIYSVTRDGTCNLSASRQCFNQLSCLFWLAACPWP